ncbi:MAG: AAA family ATPase [Terriglobales bacterium]
MAVKLTLLAAEDSERRHLEAIVSGSAHAEVAGPGMRLPIPFAAAGALLRHPPEAVLLSLPPSDAGTEAALAMVQWLRQQLGVELVMVVGPLDPARRIVEIMRVGASEYLEAPLRREALEEAMARARARRATPGAAARGRLIAVVGARGGSGATTLAVNLAVALQAAGAGDSSPVLLLDAAPLGHAALYLNLKPQYTLRDLLRHMQRPDPALLHSLLVRHASGIDVLAAPSEPLIFPPTAPADHEPAAWIDLLRQTHPLVVADLSTRYDALGARLLEAASHILLVSQTDTVSLWSAAQLRQYFDPAHRLPFELVLNRYDAKPQADLDGLEALTHMPVRCRMVNAYAALREACECGQPLTTRPASAWARNVQALAGSLLGAAEPKKAHGWRPFLRVHPTQT